MKTRHTVAVLLAFMLAAAALGCTRQEQPTPQEPAAGQEQAGQEGTNQTPAEQGQPAQEPVTVRIATLPYFDYTLFVAAHELGLDREQGLEFEFTSFPLEGPAVEAMLRGSIDVAQGAIGSFTPLLPQAPDLRVFLTNNQFKGFVYIGREGEIKTFDELLEEHGGDFARAQKATLEQFRGKTLLLVKASFEGMLKSALQQVGTSLDDVTVMDFQNDAQAAAAFLRGEGDLYTGSLAQEVRLLKEDGYVAVAGNEVLGPAGLWFSNSAVTETYLNEHRDIVLKLAAIYYRTTRYLYEKPDETLGAMINYLNEQAATNLTMEDAVNLRDEFEEFFTIERSQETVYNPESPLYWRKAATHFVQQNEELEKIPVGSVDMDQTVAMEEIFQELLANRELMEWINAPVE